MQVILYHIQILKQDLNQSNIKAESAQEAIIHHTDILIDSLVAYTLSPSNAPYQVHPYKVLSCSSSTSTCTIETANRHSIASVYKTENTAPVADDSSESSTKTLITDQYYPYYTKSAKERSDTDTVGKKFMRSIHSLKSRPAFPMTLLPHRQSVEPMNPEQPPKKKRIFYDRINEEDSYLSDEGSWDDTSSNHSSTAVATAKTNSTTTIRSLFASHHSGNSSKATKRASRGIRDLFHSSHTFKAESQYGTKKKRESISTLFTNSHTRKQSTTKEAENQQSQGSLYSSSSTATSLSTCSTESMNQHFEAMPIDDDVPNDAKSHLIPPFAKKINIHWSMEEEDVSKNWRNQRELYRVEQIHPQHEEHGEEDEEADSEDSYNQAIVVSTLKRDKSRKRRSNGSLVPAPVKALLSAPMTRENSPLPPLPTVENFLTIMNAPTSPDSSYFSARSVSSNSSSHSTLNSILLDDVTDGLASTHIMEPCLSTDSQSSSGASSIESTTKKADVQVTIKSPCSSSASSIPPPVPPKDHDLKRMLTMDPQDNSTTNINNKQEKRSSITMSPETLKRVHSSKKKKTGPSATEMRITTSDISESHHAFFAPKSADATSSFRPPIPPRRSSMPLPPPKFDSNAAVPPLPADAKKKADAYSRRPSKLDDASSWTSFLGIKKEEATPNHAEKRAKLGRSLGASPKKPKKADSNNLLKVTENGRVVLLYEMVHGKLQVIAGTTERLFEKLADETAQDMEYVDTFLMNYSSFTTSVHLLNQLISRFHLGPLPGEYEYFKKWQHSIQSKVLTVIDRWITLQYQDFKYDLDLQKKLNLFLFNNDTVLLQQFKQQVEKIQYNLKMQIQQFSNHQHHVSMITANHHISAPPSNAFSFHFSFGNSSQSLPTTVHTNNTPNSRRPSNGLFSSSSSSIMPDLPTQIHDSSSLQTTLHASLVSLESKDIARYLTLADFYLFKSIQSRELMTSNNNNNKTDINYTELMTKRANMLSHWVVHEICSVSYLKPKRSLLKKFIEIAKLCLEFNNFHTCMVITMGLTSAPKLKEVRETLSNRDTNTFASLQKLLDVSMNMRYYRQKIQLAKSPSIPFLPVVLKDQTFFRENSTFLISHPHLINFAKFTSIRQFVDKTKALTRENYYFSNDLTRYPFFSMSTTLPATPAPTKTTSPEGPLDCIADWVEDRLSQVQTCYLHCDLLSKL
ncbi:hypothetical protein PS15m_010186 [Mucor circinelloides]